MAQDGVQRRGVRAREVLVHRGMLARPLRRVCAAAQRAAGSRPRVTAQVAATDDALDEDLVGLPAGEVHGWWRGQNETVCGLSLSRSRLRTFPGLVWGDVQPASGGSAELVQVVCPRCRAALEGRTCERRSWTRERPRPWQRPWQRPCCRACVMRGQRWVWPERMTYGGRRGVRHAAQAAGVAGTPGVTGQAGPAS